MIGQPILFNLDLYYALIEQYIASDEVEHALWLMNNPPAFYKDHPPERLLKMREELHRQLWTPAQYRGIYDSVSNDGDHWPMRAQALEEIMLDRPDCNYNIMELAGGSGWLEAGLKKRGIKFRYEQISLDKVEIAEKKEFTTNIFVAFELIEHLHNPWEIYQNYLKFDKPAHYVLISTPLYTWAGGCAEDWRTRPLGHLRTYGPAELHRVVSEMFKGYVWECRTDNTIVLIGKKNA